MPGHEDDEHAWTGVRTIPGVKLPPIPGSLPTVSPKQMVSMPLHSIGLDTLNVRVGFCDFDVVSVRAG